ncbi:olfactory receptor 10A4-like [Microcaecilia unicolor]|uniref:Olfactory receptor 10A4-like n=1 Tax=Microcaecilia unicolor TaxID=1415580 RepID=A0A6P7WW56_9AMPH|nr:olfactory receptor 10A4-like [Microcaecilia unicolor]
MIWNNHTSITKFVLLGFSRLPSELQMVLFGAILVIYLTTLIGNIMAIVIITVDPLLHTPMYWFLKNLSIIEICFTTSVAPKMLGDLLSKDKSISFMGCATQMVFFFTPGQNECLLLAVMAYDRYVAICDPLHYTTVMSWFICIRLMISTWLASLLMTLAQTIFIFSLSYCGPNEINHFFCDVSPMLDLACEDTSMNKVSIFVDGIIVLLMPFALILFSYINILFTILRIRSVEGKRRAFSTCSSHLTSVTLFYGTAISVYMIGSNQTRDTDKFCSLLYCIVTPMLNPMIYCLRNQEFKKAFQNFVGKIST